MGIPFDCNFNSFRGAFTCAFVARVKLRSPIFIIIIYSRKTNTYMHIHAYAHRNTFIIHVCIVAHYVVFSKREIMTTL